MGAQARVPATPEAKPGNSRPALGNIARPHPKKGIGAEIT